jgi:predicted phage tail protein
MTTTREPAGVDAPVTGAQDGHPNPLVRVLNAVPRLLASKVHVVFLFGLGVFLVVLPLVGVAVSAKAELIGGNYTNVTSDLGACIAAGGTVHLVRRHRAHQRELADLHAKVDSLLVAVKGQQSGRPAGGEPA